MIHTRQVGRVGAFFEIPPSKKFLLTIDFSLFYNFFYAKITHTFILLCCEKRKRPRSVTIKTRNTQIKKNKIQQH